MNSQNNKNYYLSIDRDTGHCTPGERLPCEINPVGDYVIFYDTMEEAEIAAKAIQKRPFLADKLIKTL